MDPSIYDSPILVEDNEEYEVEQILNDRIRWGKQYYYVRWKGWSPAYDQWIREENLEHAQELLQDYRSKKRLEEKPLGDTTRPSKRRKKARTSTEKGHAPPA